MSKYELELKKILAGEGGDFLDSICKTLPKKKEEAYRIPLKKPMAVVRGAGSLQIDLTAMREDFYLNFEVKSSKDPTVYFSDSGNDEQADEHLQVVRDTKVPLAYAYRLKGRTGEKWQLYGLEKGSSLDFIPRVSKTRQDNRKMEFGEGLWLSDFLKRVLDNSI